MYELLYIVPSPFTEKDLPNISKKVEEIVNSFGGKIKQEENLGNRKLAYPIKQIYRGFYVLVEFEVDSLKLKELNLKLKLTPEILRYLVTKKIPVVFKKRRPFKEGVAGTLDESQKEKGGEIKSSLTEEEREEKQEGKQEGKQEEKRGKRARTPKVDFKKLGEKIDNLFKL